MADHFHALATGQRIEDYEIRYVLGEGGFGLTYLAHDMKLDKPVAIKEYLPADLAVRKGDNSVIPKSSGSESDFTWGLQRFLDEARMLARFDHKNIVRVHRFFQAHGTAYIVMEYVDGETLSSLLQREQTLSYQPLLSILNPLLSGLEIVHKGDVLHRDIKPGNIIIRDSGAPVLIDFGAARQAVGARSRSVTAIVTPGYAPIEQYSTRGRQGPWTDIYALGAICYRAMTGETPIDATERVRRDPLVPLSKQPIPEGYPGSFLGAVDRALSVDEEERPQSIGEWRDMFEGRVEAGAISAPTADERAKTRPLPRDSRPAASTGQSQAPSGFKPSKELVFGGIGAVAVTGLVITLLSAAIHQSDCTDWNSLDFFSTASAKDVRACLQAGADPEARSESGYTPLHMATINGNADAIAALLEAGADPNARSEDGETPLHRAAVHGQVDVIAALVEAGADPNARDRLSNSTPLHRAALFGQVDVIAALVEAGADPNAWDRLFNSTPLHKAAFNDQADAIDALVEAGADPNARDRLSNTPLHDAAEQGQADAIAALLEGGADPKARDENGKTPFDLIPSDSPLIGTSAYRRLQQAR